MLISIPRLGPVYVKNLPVSIVLNSVNAAACLYMLVNDEGFSDTAI